MLTNYMKMHTDIFDKFHSSAGYFGELRVQGDNYFIAPTLPPNVEHRFNYHGRPTVSWSLNNYLGLANHTEINQVGDAALKQYGVSAPMGSRMLTGTTENHLCLEHELAQFAQKESSYLFNYGYLGVIGTMCSLVGPQDIVIIDKLAHSCIVDAALMSQATVRIFKHNNMNDLEHTLRSVNRTRRGGILIAIEGVYGMTGDIANLVDICALAKQYEARLFVDDAHGWGVMGENGRGSGEYLGVQEKIDLYFGTFAKAFASIGGVTATTKEARDWIAYNARTQIFAKSLPIIYVETIRKTLQLIIDGDKQRAHLWRISTMLKERLIAIGYTIGSGESPICSVYLPLHDENPEHAGMRFVRWLREHGVFVSAVVYPVIPRGMLMFRVVPTAKHDEQDIDITVRAFAEMRKTYNVHIAMSADERERLARIYSP